jgi:uroporphyrinogen-III synthase
VTPPVWTVASADTARRWAAAVRAAGHDALPLAWSEIVGVGDPDDVVRAIARVGPDLVLLTSPNAVRHLPAGLGDGLDAACVGEATAEAARGVGFAVRHVGRGTGMDLALELVAAGAPGLVLFLRGETVRPEGTEVLERAGWRVEDQVVYAARPRAAFGAEVAAAPAPAAVVVGSPRGAQALEAALRSARRDDGRCGPVLGIGETTAASLKSLGFGRVRACDVPGVEGILAALADLLRADPLA